MNAFLWSDLCTVFLCGHFFMFHIMFTEKAFQTPKLVSSELPSYLGSFHETGHKHTSKIL